MNKLTELLQNNTIAVLDGGVGSLLQQKGLGTQECPDQWTLQHPEEMTAIHAAYVAAGAQLISTNTFGSNRYKLGQFGLEDKIDVIIRQAIVNARQAAGKDVLVAYDIGPIGQLMQPHGELTFDTAWQLFSEQVRLAAAGGADLFIIETFSDLSETRAALLAVKENSDLPVICSLTFQANGRTLMGTDAVTAVNVLQNMGADAIGANCSGGPAELLPVLQAMAGFARIPLLVQPNAGLPYLENGVTCYPLQPQEFAQWADEFAAAGVRLLGGCCGTTPEHIRELSLRVAGLRQQIRQQQSSWNRQPEKGQQLNQSLNPEQQQRLKQTSGQGYYITALSSATATVLLGGEQPVRVVGERINPTGKKTLSRQLREGNLEYVVEEALEQVKNGAQLLDINVGVPEIDEPALMQQVVSEVQKVVQVPLVLDSGNVAALERGLRYYQGRALINSVNGRPEIMQQVFPLAKKYGAAVLGLALDAGGIPPQAEQRLEIAGRIVDTALTYGLRREDVLIDCLTLTASAQQKEALQTIRALRLVKEQLGCATVLGVSNISFGLPERSLLNATFLAMAIGAGLDLPIINPNNQVMMDTVQAAEVLTARDPQSGRYIAVFAPRQAQKNQAEQAAGQAAAVQQAADAVTTPITGNLAAKAVETKAQNALAPAAEIPADKAAGTDAAAPRISALPEDTAESRLYQQILDGNRLQAVKTAELLLQQQVPLLTIVNRVIVPALEEVGVRYETGSFFLPQLMLAAETVQLVFARMQELLGISVQASGKKIILATVYGDIHDIGKNIVKVLLENYGFEVIDLGKDVPPQVIVEQVREQQVRLVGLSALMTTTLPAMKETIRLLQASFPEVRIMVGGAVLTREYAQEIGADFYAADAREGVKIAQSIWNE